MGSLASGKGLLTIGWVGTWLLVVLSLTLVATSVFGIGS
jgi:hypothetical protein